MQPLTDREFQASATAVVRLFQKWGLSDEEARRVLGGLSAEAYRSWKDGKLPEAEAELGQRLSLLMGIHVGLRNLFIEPDTGYGWVKRPNATFEGRTPLSVMSEDQMAGIERVRRYLAVQPNP